MKIVSKMITRTRMKSDTTRIPTMIQSFPMMKFLMLSSLQRYFFSRKHHNHLLKIYFVEFTQEATSNPTIIMNLFLKTPPPKTQKHPQGDRTGVWENRTKFNQEQARIINDGIYWMENEEWTKHNEEQDNIENKVKYHFHFNRFFTF